MQVVFNPVILSGCSCSKTPHDTINKPFVLFINGEETNHYSKTFCSSEITTEKHCAAAQSFRNQFEFHSKIEVRHAYKTNKAFSKDFSFFLAWLIQLQAKCSTIGFLPGYGSGQNFKLFHDKINNNSLFKKSVLFLELLRYLSLKIAFVTNIY